MYKYDPVSDSFIKISDDGPISTGTATTIAAIADECIEKIADAVVRKMKGDVNNNG